MADSCCKIAITLIDQRLTGQSSVAKDSGGAQGDELSMYSGWDEKTFNRSGDLVAVAVLKTLEEHHTTVILSSAAYCGTLALHAHVATSHEKHNRISYA